MSAASASNQQRVREQRKRDGLCIYCAVPVTGKWKSCDPCRKATNEEHRAKYGTQPPGPVKLVTAANFKFTPLAEALLKSKEMQQRLGMRGMEGVR